MRASEREQIPYRWRHYKFVAIARAHRMECSLCIESYVRFSCALRLLPILGLVGWPPLAETADWLGTIYGSRFIYAGPREPRARARAFRIRFSRIFVFLCFASVYYAFIVVAVIDVSCI